jgi:hypothetical protein
MFAMEIIREFQGYGLNVVAQEHRTGRYSAAAADEFHRHHNLDSAAAFIWVSEPLFASVVNAERLAGRDMDLSPLAGWIYFPASSNVQRTVTVGLRMAARLKAGQAVTLTCLTAPYLNAAFKTMPPVYCTWPLRTALWIGIQYVLWTKRPLMIELRHRNRALLWHLRGKSVMAYFGRRPRMKI